jgi:hypothetical protein
MDSSGHNLIISRGTLKKHLYIIFVVNVCVCYLRVCVGFMLYVVLHVCVCCWGLNPGPPASTYLPPGYIPRLHKVYVINCSGFVLLT